VQVAPIEETVPDRDAESPEAPRAGMMKSLRMIGETLITISSSNNPSHISEQKILPGLVLIFSIIYAGICFSYYQDVD
jgi:hypothetical protein